MKGGFGERSAGAGKKREKFLPSLNRSNGVMGFRRDKIFFIFFIFLNSLTPGHQVFAEEVETAVILGSCVTRLFEDYDRTKNIELALKKIHGYALESGKTFSFNRVVGIRSARRGFRPAPVLFQDRRSIQVGGGVCQVSSTLYNAVLLADLEVIERSRHSSPITYLPLGLDATVSYGYRDLKFRNRHSFPVIIMTAILEDTVTISITGSERLPYEVELATQVTEIESPFRDRFSESGKEVIRYRIKKREGIVMEKEYLGRDYYHPVKGE